MAGLLWVALLLLSSCRGSPTGRTQTLSEDLTSNSSLPSAGESQPTAAPTSGLTSTTNETSKTPEEEEGPPELARRSTRSLKVAKKPPTVRKKHKVVTKKVSKNTEAQIKPPARMYGEEDAACRPRRCCHSRFIPFRDSGSLD